MGELLAPVGTDFSFQALLSGIGLVAIGVYAFLQPAEGSDDDDFGSGGGMMQPVAASAR